MIVSLIMVCMLETRQCSPIINGTYRTQEDCVRMSELAIEHNYQRMDREEIAPHVADFRCVNFGEAV